MFSIDTETGFDKVVLINASWGLGENVVQGAVDPDEYEVFKPLLSDLSLSPIVGKKRGGKGLKMIYTSSTGRSTKNVPTSKAERAALEVGSESWLFLFERLSATSPVTGVPYVVDQDRLLKLRRQDSPRSVFWPFPTRAVSESRPCIVFCHRLRLSSVIQR